MPAPAQTMIMQAPPVVTQAPPVYMQMQAAAPAPFAATTYVRPSVTERDVVVGGQVVERDFSRMVAPGITETDRVIGGRVIEQDFTRQIAPGVIETDRVAGGRVFERDFTASPVMMQPQVMMQPVVQTMSQPPMMMAQGTTVLSPPSTARQIMTAAPVVSRAAPSYVSAPLTTVVA